VASQEYDLVGVAAAKPRKRDAKILGLAGISTV